MVIINETYLVQERVHPLGESLLLDCLALILKLLDPLLLKFRGGHP